MAEKTNKAKQQAVYTMVERGERTFWCRIGTAFTNRDGSLNVNLDALPVNGRLHIREVQAKAETAEKTEEVAA